MKVHFSLATIVFETFELILCQMLSSQGKNAPSNPYPRYLVRLATSRLFAHYSEVLYGPQTLGGNPQDRRKLIDREVKQLTEGRHEGQKLRKERSVGGGSEHCLLDVSDIYIYIYFFFFLFCRGGGRGESGATGRGLVTHAIAITNR